MFHNFRYRKRGIVGPPPLHQKKSFRKSQFETAFNIYFEVFFTGIPTFSINADLECFNVGLRLKYDETIPKTQSCHRPTFELFRGDKIGRGLFPKLILGLDPNPLYLGLKFAAAAGGRRGDERRRFSVSLSP